MGLTIVLAKALHKLCIFLFIRAYTLGRMQIHSSLYALIIEIFQESLVVGEQTFVPIPSSPSATSLSTDRMPVHIDDQHIERKIKALEIAHQIAEILIAITPITTPPISKRVAWWEGHLSCELGVGIKCTFVIMTISHKVPVLSALSTLALSYPIPVFSSIKEQALTIVNQCPSISS